MSRTPANATVFAVMRVTLEIAVRPSSSEETLQQMHDVSIREAEGILRSKLPDECSIVGRVEFSHAVVKARTP